jgi:Arc/MetJ-type ribon-helix-helix transcriptional regulator
MTLTLSAKAEALIQQLIASGEFQNPNDAVEAGLQKLMERKTTLELVERFPPGSLAKYYTEENNAEEARLMKGCSFIIEDE